MLFSVDALSTVPGVVTDVTKSKTLRGIEKRTPQALSRGDPRGDYKPSANTFPPETDP